MANRTVQLYKYTKLPTGWRYCKAVFYPNNRVKPHAVLTPDGEQTIKDGYYCLSYNRKWEPVGIVSGLCLDLLLRSKGNGVWGVYIIALLGLFPCLTLHFHKTPRSGFWQAAWVTSALFGYIHTGNGGENRIGIFAAAFIGFVFCVSVRATGSAWWAIGSHAAWDWAETFLYGTADSGLIAPGHYLSASVPASANPLWSGGADGPEGSVLVLGVILLMLAALLLIYGRKKPALTVPASEQISGRVG